LLAIAQPERDRLTGHAHYRLTHHTSLSDSLTSRNWPELEQWSADQMVNKMTVTHRREMSPLCTPDDTTMTICSGKLPWEPRETREEPNEGRTRKNQRNSL